MLRHFSRLIVLLKWELNDFYPWHAVAAMCRPVCLSVCRSISLCRSDCLSNMWNRCEPNSVWIKPITKNQTPIWKFKNWFAIELSVGFMLAHLSDYFLRTRERDPQKEIVLITMARLSINSSIWTITLWKTALFWHWLCVCVCVRSMNIRFENFNLQYGQKGARKKHAREKFESVILNSSQTTNEIQMT